MAIKLMTQSVALLPLQRQCRGGVPAHTAFTLTSSGEPFCIVGFYVNAFSTGQSAAAKVQIELSRINGSGVSHPMMDLAEGFTVRPQDLVIHGRYFCRHRPL